MTELSQGMKVIKKLLFIMPIITVIMIIAYMIMLKDFNNQIRTTQGGDANATSYMYINERVTSTSEWIKRDFNMYGETVDLTGHTYDGYLYNNADYELANWKMTFYIQDDCFFNQMWNGDVEIHQNVDGEEKVQRFNTGDYDVNDITLEYLYVDGTLFVPLSKGDYIVYYPSTSYLEMPIASGFKTKIGFILYYLDRPDVSNYMIEYQYNRTFMEGYQFYFIVGFFTTWIVLLLLYFATDFTYKTAMREMEIKKSGILSMSDIYAIIYMIDLKNNLLTPVVADANSEEMRPKSMGANEQLQNLCAFDCSDAYREIVEDFCELTTIEERLKNRSNLVCEYISKSYGWCRIRFFAMDRDEKKPLEKVLFAIQVINEEKEEIDAVKSQVNEAEKESKAKSVFLANMSHEIRTPINTVIGLDTMILREAENPEIRSYARDIKSAAKMLLSLINGILDYSKLESDKMELVEVEYSLKQLVIDVRNMVKSRLEFDNLELKFSIAENLPKTLIGDEIRLKQVIINILTNAAKYTDEGSVELTIYGKEHEGLEHLLISVKDTGIGIKDEDQKKLAQRFTRFDVKRNHNVEGTGLGLNLVVGILELMDSELHVISKYGEGSEFYFEIEQKIVDSDPIGSLDFKEEVSDEEEYQALFVAPEAKVLVVDDNAMNRNVFVNLLKETEIQIDQADSGRTALEKTLAKEYDLIFMDHMMPEMDGVETLHQIKAQKGGKNSNTPIIVLTANALKGAEEEYKEAGFNDFLAKPIQPEMLEKMTSSYIKKEKIKKSSNRKAKDKEEEVKLPAISGVDVTYGLSHTGGINNLFSVLNQLVELADSDAKELRSYYEGIKKDAEDKEALQNYRIKVHSMKSSSNVIGALAVSGLAATLENAAREENTKKILEMTPYFLEDWETLKQAIAKTMEENQKSQTKKLRKEEVKEDTLKELLHQLETSMEAYDVKNADSLMNKLTTYKWENQKQKTIDKLKNAVANLDVEAVKECIKELLG